MRHAVRREEQVEVGGDVGQSADGRARVAGDGLLLDGDDRREAEHEINLGLAELLDKPLGERGERLHVAPLSLRVDGVERQRGFAGPADAGKDDELVARNLQVDVLQVVLARSEHFDGGSYRHVSCSPLACCWAPRWCFAPSWEKCFAANLAVVSWAASSMATRLFVVRRTGTASFWMNLRQASHSHALSTPSMLKLRSKKWFISVIDRTSPSSRR